MSKPLIKKLYNLPRGSAFKWPEKAHVPIGAYNPEPGTKVEFKHLDGMYSLCSCKGPRGKPAALHLAAWTEVEVIELAKGKVDTELPG